MKPKNKITKQANHHKIVLFEIFLELMNLNLNIKLLKQQQPAI